MEAFLTQDWQEKIGIKGFQKSRDQAGAVISCEVSIIAIMGSKAQKAVRSLCAKSMAKANRPLSRDHI